MKFFENSVFSLEHFASPPTFTIMPLPEWHLTTGRCLKCMNLTDYREYFKWYMEYETVALNQNSDPSAERFWGMCQVS